MGSQLEKQAPAADHHASPASSRSPSGKDLHRQRPNRRERDPEVLAEWYACRLVASAASHLDQKVSAQSRHNHVAENVHVGSHLS